MRTGLAIAIALTLGAASPGADITLVQTLTLQGRAAEGMGPSEMPRMTTRIKGQLARADIEVSGEVTSSILDVVAKHVIVLDHATRVATLSSAAGESSTLQLKTDLAVTPTGAFRTIDGQRCEEYALTYSADLAPVGSPPEVTAAMKDTRMVIKGSVWVALSAPGAVEFAAFNKAALASGLMSAAFMMGESGGYGKLLEGIASTPGLPYLTELTMSIEGSGEMAASMRAEMGGELKMVQKLVSVSTNPIDDKTFQIPQGYRIAKQ
jgi:hypothetical protein